MLAEKNSNHIKNRFFLVTDKVAQMEIEIHNMGTKSMWADVNTNPVQGVLFRIFRSEMMGVSVEYDDNVERRFTHPLLLPMIESERVSLPDSDFWEKISVVVPVKNVAKPRLVDKKGTVRGSKRKLMSPRAKLLEKQRSVLGKPKYGPSSKSHWKAGSARYPAFYKALLYKPSRTKRIKMVRSCDVSLSMTNQ